MCRLVSQLFGHCPSDAGSAISPLQYREDVILQLRKFRERLWSRYAAAIYSRAARNAFVDQAEASER
jgi:hypothetical protein